MPTTEEQLNRHVKECMELNKEVSEKLTVLSDSSKQTNNALVVLVSQHQSLAGQVKALEGLPWTVTKRILQWLVPIILASVVTSMTQNYLQSQQVAQNAQMAATAATQVTHQLHSLGAQ